MSASVAIALASASSDAKSTSHARASVLLRVARCLLHRIQDNALMYHDGAASSDICCADQSLASAGYLLAAAIDRGDLGRAEPRDAGSAKASAASASACHKFLHSWASDSIDSGSFAWACSVHAAFPATVVARNLNDVLVAACNMLDKHLVGCCTSDETRLPIEDRASAWIRSASGDSMKIQPGSVLHAISAVVSCLPQGPCTDAATSARIDSIIASCRHACNPEWVAMNCGIHRKSTTDSNIGQSAQGGREAPLLASEIRVAAVV